MSYLKKNGYPIGSTFLPKILEIKQFETFPIPL